MADNRVPTRFERQLRSLRPGHPVRVGKLPAAVLRAWTGRSTGHRIVELNAGGRQHYLTRHPEVAPHERRLPAVIAQPDAVHRNKRDPTVALFYKVLAPGQYLRVPVTMREPASARNHVMMSFRFASSREVARGVAEGREVWRRTGRETGRGAEV